MNKREIRSTPHTIQKRKQSQGVINDLDNVDFIPSNVNSSHQEALLYVFGRQRDMFPEPTELLLIGYSIESIWTPKAKSNTLTPKNQLADILTKGNFTRDEWNHLLCLFNISHFTSTDCSEVMSKKTQKDSGEESVTAKSKPMMNLVSAMQRKDS